MKLKVYEGSVSGDGHKSISVLNIEPGSCLKMEGALIEHKRTGEAILTIDSPQDNAPPALFRGKRVLIKSEFKLKPRNEFTLFYKKEEHLFKKTFIVLHLLNIGSILSSEEKKLIELIDLKVDGLDWQSSGRTYYKTPLYDELGWYYQVMNTITVFKGLPYRIEIKRTYESTSYKQPFDPDTDYVWYELKLVDFSRYSPKKVLELYIEQWQDEFVRMNSLFGRINPFFNDSGVVDITLTRIIKEISNS